MSAKHMKHICGKQNSSCRIRIMILIITVIVCLYLLGQLLWNWERLTETVATIIAIIAAVAFWLEYHENKELNEAQFIMELNEQFIANKELSAVEWELEKYYYRFRSGGLSKEYCEKFKERFDIDKKKRQSLVNYLVHLEGIATLINSDVLHLDTIDDLMSYRYFIAVNNPIIQEIELLAYPDYYRGIFDLYDKWVEILQKQNITIPMYPINDLQVSRKNRKGVYIMNEQKLTGYPSIDKPWLKFYSAEAINTPLPECTIYEYIWNKNKDHLGDTALIYFGRKISYEKLFNNINKAASAFSALGVKKGDIVAIALPNIPETIYCIYALNKLGAIADMVDLRSKGDILIHYLTETKASVAVICDLLAQNTFDIISETHIQKVVVASPFDSLYAPIKLAMKCKSKKLNLPETAMRWAQFVRCGNETQLSVVGHSDDVAAIFHTSGTTGMPKGVMLTNQNFNAMALQAKLSGLKFKCGESMMNQVPPFLAYNTLCATHMPLALHMQIIMLPEYRPDKFAENIMKLKPNCAIAGPADWNNFLENETLKRKAVDLSYLVSLISGSDAMSQKSKDTVNALVQKNGCREQVLEGYGMTEIGSAACVNVPQHNEDRSVGIPMPFNNFCIYDNDAERELPYNERGEICMRGPTVMRGYYNNPVETSNVLKVHADGAVWLHSGDLGYITEDGCVYLDGRLKRIIIRHDGIKVSPFVVEEILMKHKDVTACCVVGAFDNEHQMGQVPVAFIVTAENAESKRVIAEVKALCAAELAENYRPHVYSIATSLPLTSNGKVDYIALEKEAEKELKS